MEAEADYNESGFIAGDIRNTDNRLLILDYVAQDFIRTPFSLHCVSWFRKLLKIFKTSTIMALKDHLN